MGRNATRQGERLTKETVTQVEPLEAVREYYRNLSAQRVDERLARAGEEGDVASVRSLLEHYTGDWLPESLDKLINIISSENDNGWMRHHQEASLSLLASTKVLNKLRPEQHQNLVCRLVHNNSLPPTALRRINEFIEGNEAWKFPVRELRAVAAGISDYSILALVIERQHGELEATDVDHILEHVIANKRQTKEYADQDRPWQETHSLRRYDTSAVYRDKLLTERHRQSHMNSAYNSAHKIFLSIISLYDKDLSEPQIETFLKEDSYNNTLTEALVTHRFHQLTQEELRRKVERRLGVFGLLRCLADGELADPRWTDRLLNEAITAIGDNGHLLARLPETSWMRHISPEHIDQLIEKGCLDVLLSLLAGRPDKLSDQQARLVADKLEGGEESRLASIELDRALMQYVADLSRDNLDILQALSAGKSPERWQLPPPHVLAAGAKEERPELTGGQITMLLEHYGYRLLSGLKEVESVGRYGRYFSTPLVDQLLAYGSKEALAVFISLYPEKIAPRQVQKIFRDYSTGHFFGERDKTRAREIIRELTAKRFDQCDIAFLVAEGSVQALGEVMSQQPAIFTSEKLEELERGNLYKVLPLAVKLVEDWSPEKIDSFIDIANQAALMTSTVQLGYIEQALRLLVQKANPSPAQISRLIKSDRNGLVSKSILKKYGSSLPPQDAEKAISKAGQLFQKRFEYVDHEHTYSY